VEEPARSNFELLQDHTLRASWKTQIRAPLQSIFAGVAFKAILDECQKIHGDVLRGRVWVALHMHAGRRQRAHQHPGQQRQLRDAADRAHGGGADHEARPRP
jgi:flagellar biosynthesis regulator FlbT